MKENIRFAWFATWFALVGQLVFFLGVSIFTGEWRYVMWSFMVSLLAGIPSLVNTWQAQKRINLSKLDQ